MISGADGIAVGEVVGGEEDMMESVQLISQNNVLVLSSLL